MTRPSRPRGGMTLAEVLIALAVLAAIVAAFAPVLRASIKLSRAVADAGAQREDLRTTENLLRRMLSGIVVPSTTNADVFNGASVGFSFYTTSSLNGRIVQADIGVAPRGAQRALVLSLGPASASNQIVDVVLIDDVEGVTFQYWGRRALGDKQAFHDVWRQGPPEMISISGRVIVRDRVSKPFSFDIGIAQRAAVFCQFDHVSRRCRS